MFFSSENGADFKVVEGRGRDSKFERDGAAASAATNSSAVFAGTGSTGLGV
jgi:hypothetical protein